jgi:ATP/maltotriose-dependent transcriptional regulator MalT
VQTPATFHHSTPQQPFKLGCVGPIISYFGSVLQQERAKSVEDSLRCECVNCYKHNCIRQAKNRTNENSPLYHSTTYSRGSEVMSHLGLYPIHSTLPHRFIQPFLNIYSIYTKPSANKTSRREHSEREIAIILVLHAKGYSTREINDEIDIPKSTINTIILLVINSLDR